MVAPAVGLALIWAAAEERLAGDVGRLEQEVYQLMVGLCTFNSVNP